MSDICEICKDTLDTDIIVLNCDHKFHLECYYSTNDTKCPYCRKRQNPIHTKKKLLELLEFKKKDSSYCQAITSKGNLCLNFCGSKAYCGKHKNYHKKIEAMKSCLQS